MIVSDNNSSSFIFSLAVFPIINLMCFCAPHFMHPWLAGSVPSQLKANNYYSVDLSILLGKTCTSESCIIILEIVALTWSPLTISSCSAEYYQRLDSLSDPFSILYSCCVGPHIQIVVVLEEMVRIDSPPPFRREKDRIVSYVFMLKLIENLMPNWDFGEEQWNQNCSEWIWI